MSLAMGAIYVKFFLWGGGFEPAGFMTYIRLKFNRNGAYFGNHEIT
jgi:hypothetical protein